MTSCKEIKAEYQDLEIDVKIKIDADNVRRLTDGADYLEDYANRPTGCGWMADLAKILREHAV